MRQEFEKWGAGFNAVVAYTPGWQTRNITLVDGSSEHRSSQDFSGFGHHYQYDPPGNPELAGEIIEKARSFGMPAALGIHGIDHAISIPLFFLLPDGETPVTPVSQSLSGVRQATFLGECLSHLGTRAHGRILLLMSGIWSQNPKEMAKGSEDRLISEWVSRILSSLKGESDPDWSILPLLTGEILDRMDPPGRLRELHLLKGLGARNAKVWECERALGLFQSLITFDPVQSSPDSGRFVSL
jgi:4,5-DOPA dioxygenase extradiol